MNTMTAEAGDKYLSTVDDFVALPVDTRETFRRCYERTVETVGIWHQAGVPILAGTDGAGRVPGNSLQLEFRELAKAGLSPLEVLRSATTSPRATSAAPAGWAGSRREWTPTWVLLDADPLASVDNLASIARRARRAPLHRERACEPHRRTGGSG
ncbi:MAG TPA: hypothetical protein VNO31_16395 [Umezawaea sp.]|nr:hypothetical protein [Umezawaea sp.]